MDTFQCLNIFLDSSVLLFVFCNLRANYGLFDFINRLQDHIKLELEYISKLMTLGLSALLRLLKF